MAQRLGFDSLGGFIGQRRQVVAQGKRQADKTQAQQHQRAQGLPGPQPTGAQNREFRALRQPRHNKNSADQYRNRHQLVQMAGDHQGDIDQRFAQGVAQRLVALYGIELIAQVKKQK